MVQRDGLYSLSGLDYDAEGRVVQLVGTRAWCGGVGNTAGRTT